MPQMSTAPESDAKTNLRESIHLMSVVPASVDAPALQYCTSGAREGSLNSQREPFHFRPVRDEDPTIRAPSCLIKREARSIFEKNQLEPWLKVCSLKQKVPTFSVSYRINVWVHLRWKDVHISPSSQERTCWSMQSAGLANCRLKQKLEGGFVSQTALHFIDTPSLQGKHLEPFFNHLYNQNAVWITTQNSTSCSNHSLVNFSSLALIEG